jgi:hypothetical protein
MITACAALNYLSQIADRLFESYMQRVAIRMRAHSKCYPH